MSPDEPEIPERREPQGVQLPVVWVGADDLPVQFVNQFLGVVHPNEIFLTLGTLVPPAIIGDSVEERRKQVENLPFVPIKPIARVALTPARLEEMIRVLQDTLTNYEAQQKALNE